MRRGGSLALGEAYSKPAPFKNRRMRHPAPSGPTAMKTARGGPRQFQFSASPAVPICPEIPKYLNYFFVGAGCRGSTKSPSNSIVEVPSPLGVPL
jgi:hypothetical protein